MTGTGPAANYSYTSTTIQYSSAAQLPEVNTLKAALGPVVVQKDTALGTGSINLILGSNYHGLSTGKSAGQVVGQDAQQPGQELRRYHRERQHLQGLGGVRRPGQPAAGGMSHPGRRGLGGAGLGHAAGRRAAPPGRPHPGRPDGSRRRAPSWDTISQVHRPSGYMK